MSVTPSGDTAKVKDLPEPQSLWFARTSRGLADQARRLGLLAPSFISPPSATGAIRTIRTGGATPVVAVRLRGRRREQILGDLIEGIVLANRLAGPRSAVVRSQLWDTAADHLIHVDMSRDDLAAHDDPAAHDQTVVTLDPKLADRLPQRSPPGVSNDTRHPGHAVTDHDAALAS
ncbi:MAG: hypothetical protein KDB86_08000 [Actinobacteria bacterium]|nr:hypothetical protein [Actinomycetota bacterium]